jgi:hypothetical protein
MANKTTPPETLYQRMTVRRSTVPGEGATGLHTNCAI